MTFTYKNNHEMKTISPHLLTYFSTSCTNKWFLLISFFKLSNGPLIFVILDPYISNKVFMQISTLNVYLVDGPWTSLCIKYYRFINFMNDNVYNPFGAIAAHKCYEIAHAASFFCICYIINFKDFKIWVFI